MSEEAGLYSPPPPFPAAAERPPDKEERVMEKKDGVELKVTDQLHISSVKADTMGKGERFTTDPATAKDLVERGLATRVGGAKVKAEPANKAAQPARTQAAPAARTQVASASRNQAAGAGRSAKASKRR
jgi:hypothetical protein